MDYTNIVPFITSVALIGSMILNWVQFRANKRGTKLDNYSKQLDLIVNLQKTKDQKYQEALKTKDLEIESLRKDLTDMREKMEVYAKRLNVLQNAVNRLIGDGCKDSQCPAKKPYTIEDLTGILNIEQGE